MSDILNKVKDFGNEIKTHWNTPAEGKYVPYKEYKDVVIGVGANYTGTKTLEYIGFWSSCFLIMHHYKLPYLTFSVIGLLNMPSVILQPLSGGMFVIIWASCQRNKKEKCILFTVL